MIWYRFLSPQLHSFTPTNLLSWSSEGRVRSWNPFVFSLSLHPVGRPPHNEFIASVRSTTFGLCRKCLKIDKPTTSKEIHFFPRKWISTTTGLPNNKKGCRFKWESAWELTGSYKISTDTHTCTHQQYLGCLSSGLRLNLYGFICLKLPNAALPSIFKGAAGVQCCLCTPEFV